MTLSVPLITFLRMKYSPSYKRLFRTKKYRKWWSRSFCQTFPGGLRLSSSIFKVILQKIPWPIAMKKTPWQQGHWYTLWCFVSSNWRLLLAMKTYWGGNWLIWRWVLASLIYKYSSLCRAILQTTITTSQLSSFGPLVTHNYIYWQQLFNDAMEKLWLICRWSFRGKSPREYLSQDKVWIICHSIWKRIYGKLSSEVG